MASNNTEITTSLLSPTSQIRTSSFSAPPPIVSSSSPPSIVAPPSTFVPSPTAAPPSPSSVVLITSTITESPASTGGTGSASVVFITSTAPPTFSPTTPLTQASSAIQSSPTSASVSLATSTAQSSEPAGGLPQGGKIAVAVVVPIAAIALIVVGLLFFWKKRKARKSAKEQRKTEMEEYGFNPNNDPTLPSGGAAYGENKSEEAEGGAGYRGWRATNSATTRKPSTNLGSGRGGIGVALSDGGSNGVGNGYQTSPSYGTERPSDGQSNEPLVGSPGARPTTGDSDLAALGAAPVAGSARQDRGIHRGPSNASSAYSTGPARSEVSDDIPAAGSAPAGPYYHEDSPYYNDGHGQPGSYGDNSFGGGQPVIRDVQARRNTRIEKPSIFPQPGSSGIAQNF